MATSYRWRIVPLVGVASSHDNVAARCRSHKKINLIGRTNLFRKEAHFICGSGFPAAIIEHRFFAAGKPLPPETKKSSASLEEGRLKRLPAI
jgi:hypothetical protein